MLKNMVTDKQSNNQGISVFDNECNNITSDNVIGSRLYFSNINRPTFLEICIPTYRRPQHLLDSISSIVSQIEGVDILLSIYDDSISEINDAVLLKSVELPARIRCIKNVCNLGIDANINQCFSNAVGKYVLTIGEDDILMPNMLCHLVALLKQEAPDILYTSYVYLNNAKNSIIRPPLKINGAISPVDFIEKYLWAVGFIGSVVVSKGFLDKNQHTYLGTYFNHVGRVCINLNHESLVYASDHPIVGNRSDDLSSATWSKNYFDVLFGFESLLITLSSSKPFGLSFYVALSVLRKRFGYLRFLNLCNMRGLGIFDIKVYNKYRSISRGFVFDRLGKVICFLPSRFFSPVVLMWPLLRNLKRYLHWLLRM
jgi:glycosyltransferase involved in cell wall biosynthesis